ncbi:phosphotransferase family protein [Luedemannella helvata]|uniref:Phosphotransferase family protein n=1 Tax=Luedemannella helvata TaxID=349315 RepID=A0ABN2JWF5_9ACTN
MTAPNPPGLDLTRLAGYLNATVPGLLTGDLTGEVIAGGRSNLTYAVTDGASRWVLRRPPLGHVLATAHDMSREYRVMGALGPTGFPVPPMVHLCADPEVLGAPFYLMGYVDGEVLRSTAALARLGPDGVLSRVLEIVRTLADLHRIDPAEVGLAGFGRPDGYNERQVRTWTRQLAASRSRDLPGADELAARLAQTVPATSAAAVVHGDFRVDNVIFAGERIAAVLDWEMSTLGDPLADVALMLTYATHPAPAPDGGPDRAPSDAPGYPDVATMVAHYAERSGRDVGNLRWYRAFAAFKLAAILEGVHYRYTRGLTVGEGFETIGARVVPLITQGRRILEGD